LRLLSRKRKYVPDVEEFASFCQRQSWVLSGRLSAEESFKIAVGFWADCQRWEFAVLEGKSGTRRSCIERRYKICMAIVQGGAFFENVELHEMRNDK
jgi:hypothetical protein